MTETYKEFRKDVVAGVAAKLGWTVDEADRATGDLSDHFDDAMTVDESVTAIVDAIRDSQ